VLYSLLLQNWRERVSGGGTQGGGGGQRCVHQGRHFPYSCPWLYASSAAGASRQEQLVNKYGRRISNKQNVLVQLTWAIHDANCDPHARKHTTNLHVRHIFTIYDSQFIKQKLRAIWHNTGDFTPTQRRSRESSVGTATSYGLDRPGIESRWRRDFPQPSRLALEPTQPPTQRVPGFSPHLALRLEKE
jgi:hypothetical protein